MLILALDSAVARCSATLVSAGTVVVGFQQDLERGHASVLPVMARDCLHGPGLQVAELDIIAVTVGPGSFTGIRAGVALAQGIAVAAGCPVIAVTVGEALAESLFRNLVLGRCGAPPRVGKEEYSWKPVMKYARLRSPNCRIHAAPSPSPVRPRLMSPAGSPLEG